MYLSHLPRTRCENETKIAIVRRSLSRIPRIRSGRVWRWLLASIPCLDLTNSTLSGPSDWYHTSIRYFECLCGCIRAHEAICLAGAMASAETMTGCPTIFLRLLIAWCWCGARIVLNNSHTRRMWKKCLWFGSSSAQMVVFAACELWTLQLYVRLLCALVFFVRSFVRRSSVR